MTQRYFYKGGARAIVICKYVPDDTEYGVLYLQYALNSWNIVRADGN